MTDSVSRAADYTDCKGFGASGPKNAQKTGMKKTGFNNVATKEKNIQTSLN